MEIVSEEGYRKDGRLLLEYRPIEIHLEEGDVTEVRYEQGQTVLFISIYGPKECKHHKDINHSDVFLDVHIKTLAFQEHGFAEKKISHLERKMKELFESVIMGKILARSAIEVHVNILQGDGSEGSAIINGISFALIHAGIPTIGMVTAVTLGYHTPHFLVDVTQQEKRSDIALATVAMLSRRQELMYIDSNAGIPIDSYDTMLSLAGVACEQILADFTAHLSLSFQQ